MPSDGLSGSGELGIDFGTSNTVAVVRRPDGRVQPLLFDGSPLLPSAVYAEPAGGLIVGRDAVHSSRLDPARYEPNPKRRIDDGTVLLGDRELPVVDLIQAVLGRVMEEWRRAAGGADAPRATLTCPAVWANTRRQALTQAAARVGLTGIRLVAEPVAAATYYAQSLGRDVPIGSVVVVHDFGAGTFDASVVARTSSGFDVLAVDGRDDIGGIDIDSAILGHLRTLYEPQAPEAWARLTSPSTVEERRAKLLLWEDLRAAKERLSRNPTADLVIPLADLQVHLTREELEALARPLLDQTVRVTQGVIKWSNLAPGRLAGVFLVGGSSRIPLLATLLHRELGEPPVVLEQPELVVAEGSILAGAVELGSGSQAAPGPATGVLPKLTPEMFGPAGMPAAPGSSGGPPLPVPPLPVPPLPVPPAAVPSVAGVPSAGPSAAGNGAPSAAAGVPAGVSASPVSPGLAPASPGPAPGAFPPAPVSPGRAPASAPVSPGPAPASAPVSPGPAPASAPGSPGLAPASPAPTGARAPASTGAPAAQAAPAPAKAPAPAPAFAPAEAAPVSPAPPRERSVGRVIVPGAQPPTRSRGPAAPTAPTRHMPRIEEPAPAPAPPAVRPQRTPAPEQRSAPRPAPAPQGPRRQIVQAPVASTAPQRRPAPLPQYPKPRRRGRFRRFLLRLFVALLLIVVPLLSAAVAYYLTADQPPDLDRLLRELGLR